MGNRGALLAVAVPLIAFKAWVCILLLIYMPTEAGLALIAATHWPWVIVIVLLMAGPGIAWYRLMRARARRERLQRAEWMTDNLDAVSAPRSRPRAAAQCSELWDTVSRLEGDG